MTTVRGYCRVTVVQKGKGFKIIKILLGCSNKFYSLLNANTGSSLAALLEGIIPPINVKIILSTIKIIPAIEGNTALTSTPFAIEAIILFIGISNNKVIPTPIIPASAPIILHSFSF